MRRRNMAGACVLKRSSCTPASRVATAASRLSCKAAMRGVSWLREPAEMLAALARLARARPIDRPHCIPRKAGRTCGSQAVALSLMISAVGTCTCAILTEAVLLPRRAIRSRSSLRCTPAQRLSKATIAGGAPSFGATAAAATKPALRRFVTQARPPSSSKPPSWRVAVICSCSMPDKNFMAFDRPLAPACLPVSRSGKRRSASARFGLCSMNSIKQRWPQKTKATVTDCSATLAIAWMASRTSPPAPPYSCGTPVRSRSSPASAGKTFSASAGDWSSWSACVCSQSVSCAISDGAGQVRRQLWIDRRAGQAVAEIAEGGQTDAEHHFQRLLLVVASAQESLIVSVGDGAARGDDGAGKRGDGVQLGVARQLAMLQGAHHFSCLAGFFQGDGAMAGDAKIAAMDAGRRDLHYFAFHQRQAGTGIDAGNGQIGFQRHRGVGQHADQVGQVAIVGDGLFHERAAVKGSGIEGL